jgi:hypothetical protein
LASAAGNQNVPALVDGWFLVAGLCMCGI